ncbi:MAG: alkaline phosphatase family protein [Verrucomicrobiae bacterium]|nr:alkaline phosphatase family protein [Verrucomicrobiae bacterium]
MKPTQNKFIMLGLDGACPGIIQEATRRGLLPNFKQLAERGVHGRSLPVPSSVTSVNWTSIATGAPPSVTGISDFAVHTPGTPLDEAHDVFGKDVNHQAEFVWDAYAQRGYRAATVSFVGALPQTWPGHLAIGDHGYPEEYSLPYSVAPSRLLVTGTLNPVGPYNWKEHETITPTQSSRTRMELTTHITACNTPYSGQHPVTLTITRSGHAPQAEIRVGGHVYAMGLREWSPWIECAFTRDTAALQKWQTAPLTGGTCRGLTRMRLVYADLERGEIQVYVSPVYPADHFSSEDELTSKLSEELGPYSDNLPISRLLMGWIDEDGFIDEFRLQGLWQARAAVRLANDHGFKAVLTKWHAFDKFYHFFLQRIDPVSDLYHPAEAPPFEALHTRLLQVADEMVGIVLEGLREDTTLVVVSDHGLMASRKSVWVNRFLAQHGYIHFAEDAAGKVTIDWSRTRAYVSAYLCLNINTRGRDPQGIVSPGPERDGLIAELIRLLRDWKDPETGAHVMTDVFEPAKDGAWYGLGHPADGDIRYFSAPGYTFFRSTDVAGREVLTPTEGPYLGDHGSCRPTTCFGRGSELGIFYAAGCGIEARGTTRDVGVCDIVPTLLHIAGEAPLRHQQGAVRYDWLKP